MAASARSHRQGNTSTADALAGSATPGHRPIAGSTRLPGSGRILIGEAGSFHLTHG
ncbi:hypothetical protein XFF7767_10054 [Xanthomonas citri pv. fuscans]|nr:hypothetical protein XFF7767_10054 [Xanthomonas citri pv. fuscans]